ncbi:low molecular weight phosphatase family protein [Lentibacter algarum]|uniref:arsenate-mycothiol transferase ArsC n=1 Tax=Lentibacter algarum TaxID=576131 RepID=UPI001C06EEF7|nr:low molecular weight phosphatase family protein [Lentibacter algarum]MBU2981704.1 low molecular weight phosphatase family protein [Lentibacter algarum]
MPHRLPQSVLFCCDHNAVRSPMAEGIMKQFYGTGTYVQSAGVRNDLEIDGFSIAVCAELGVELARHRSRSFDDMERMGEVLSSFDVIVALSERSRDLAAELTQGFHCELEYWPIVDPTAQGETRDAKLEAYRKARDQIVAQIKAHWGDGAS